MSAQSTDPKVVLGPIVRSTGPTWTSFWIQLDRRCALVAELKQHHPAPKTKAAKGALHSAVTSTVELNGRLFALVRVEGLQAATLYDYGLFAVTLSNDQDAPATSRELRKHKRKVVLDLGERVYGRTTTVRTFGGDDEELRVAFGSCRAAEGGEGQSFGEDALVAHAKRLADTAVDRVTTWPALLLMLGDQIYGDNVSQEVIRIRGAEYATRAELPSLETVPASGKTNSFLAGFQCFDWADFATAYEVAWRDEHVAKLLAHIPTFMTCDDHELTDDWDITGGWRDQAVDDGKWLDTLTNGLCAFWVYQAWGNPYSDPPDSDDPLDVLEAAMKSGRDAYLDLYELMSDRLKQKNTGHLRSYFRIDTTPRIVVLDTRGDRTLHTATTVDGVTIWTDERDRIIGSRQRAWFQSEIDGAGLTIIASSVPFLQTPPIDVALLALGRPQDTDVQDVERASQSVSNTMEELRRSVDADTWCAFPDSWVAMLEDLRSRGPFIWLAGDVHYSYLQVGGVNDDLWLLHAVSSGFRKRMNDSALDRLEHWTEFSSTVASKDLSTDVSLPVIGDLEVGLSVEIPAALVAGLVGRGLVARRLEMPDMAAVFGPSEGKGGYTTENNIGVVRIYDGGSRCSVVWYSAGAIIGNYDLTIGS